MKGKNIKTHLKRKIGDWIANINDQTVKDAILENAIITGGAIVSLLQDEKPRDYDIYFRNEESLKLVAEYYVKKYIEANKEKFEEEGLCPSVQRCYWNEERKVWSVLGENSSKRDDERIRVFIRSVGAVGVDYEPHGETDSQYRRAMAQIGEELKKNPKASIGELPAYSPIFITNNAITLKDDVQIILRFYGSPEEIHKNYDFVHCTSYWTSWDNELVMPARALEAIINKELYYVGSKYPLCSIIRSRKFLKRGWHIDAGQYVKMVLQLNALDLKNLHVFEEQLIGVDSAYFSAVINKVNELQEDRVKVDERYLIKLINEVFDESVKEDDET